jgi:hypothetical protein
MAEKITQNGLELNVMSSDDILDQLIGGAYRLRTMLYGKQGSGKSSTAASHPGKVGVLDCDNGAMVYKNNASIIQIQEDAVLPGQRVEPKAWLKAQAALDYFMGAKVDAIVIDSMSTLSDACMKRILFEAGKQAGQETFTEWRRQMDLLTNFVFKAFGSGKDTIVICHEEFDKDDVTGQIWCLPLITGKLAEKMPNWFDEVYHMMPDQDTKGNPVYKMMTKATRMYACKSRLDTYLHLDTMIPADLKPIKAKLDGMKKTA